MPTSSMGPPAPKGGKQFWLILAALIVVLAGAGAFWYFVMRGTSGNEFLGTWTQKGSSALAQGTYKITREGGKLVLYTTDSKGQTMGPLGIKVKGRRLVTTFEYVGDDPKQRAAAAMLQGLMTSMIDDFKMVFYFDGGKLYVRVEGKPKADVQAGSDWSTPLELTKAEAPSP
jgi:hypothetical protein